VPRAEQFSTKQDIINHKKSSTPCNEESKPKVKSQKKNSADSLKKISTKGHAISRTQNCDSKRFFCTFKMPNGNKCDRGYTHNKSLVRHLEEGHEGKKIPCEICSKTFSRKSNLATHMKDFH